MKTDLWKTRVVLCLVCCLVGCVQYSASAQETSNAQETGKSTQQSHEALAKAAQALIEDKETKLKHLELDVAKADGRARLADAKVKEFDSELTRDYVVMKTVLDNLQGCDYDVFLVGRRRYSRQDVYEGITAQQENLCTKEKYRQETEALKLAWQDAAAEGRMAVQRIRRHLSKAKAKLSEQESRRKQAQQRLTTASLLQETCPQGDLLLASDTELGQTLAALELEVSTLEALVDLRGQSSWNLLDALVAEDGANVTETESKNKKGKYHATQKK